MLKNRRPLGHIAKDRFGVLRPFYGSGVLTSLACPTSFMASRMNRLEAALR
jgi:hypothetical protein